MTTKTKTAAKKPTRRRAPAKTKKPATRRAPAKKTPVRRKSPVKKTPVRRASKKPVTRRKTKTAAKTKAAVLVMPTPAEVMQASGVPQVAEADLPVPTGWRLLVKMAEPKRMSAGGVHMPDVSVEAEEYLVYVGKVLRMGPLCYSPERPAFEGGAPWCKVGDWIAFGQHAGQAIEIFGERFKILNDDSVMAVIPKPDIIKIYV